MKVFHIGLCVNPHGFSSFPHAFKKVLGEENYREIQCSNDSSFNNNCIEILKEFKPDIVFMQIQAEGIIHPYVCEHAIQMGAKVINWTGDKRHTVPQWMIDLAPFVSVTAFSNMEDVRKMRYLCYNSEYLEIGYDPEIYKPEGEAHNVPEIVFMGNNYGEGHFPMSEFRIKMVQFLQQEYGDRFGVFGTGWSNSKGNYNHSQHEEAKAYRGCKVAINCSHFDAERYNSDRLLRILGTGAACISFRHHGMEQDYKGGEDIVYFETLEQLKFHIDTVLEGDIYRNNIAENGQQLVKNRNTFVHMVENLIKLVA
jgi:spore maturation protein CgeB